MAGRFHHSDTSLFCRAQKEIFYIDDRPELVESAKSLGIRGHVFTNFAQLISDLGESGITFLPQQNPLPF